MITVEAIAIFLHFCALLRAAATLLLLSSTLERLGGLVGGFPECQRGVLQA